MLEIPTDQQTIIWQNNKHIDNRETFKNYWINKLENNFYVYIRDEQKYYLKIQEIQAF